MKKVSKNRAEKKEKSHSWLESFGLGGEREIFIENFSMLVSSGVGIIPALSSLQEEKLSKRMIDRIEEIKNDIESGSSLSKALKRTGLFSDHTLSLIRIGEESGQLSQNLQVIAQQQVKDKSFKSKIRSAMMYPIFVMGLALVIGVGIAWFILPKLSTVFSQLNLELPTVTRWLIATGNFLGENGAWFLPLVILGFVIMIMTLFVFPKTKVLGQRFLFNIPGIKSLIREVELARFGYLLGTLLAADISAPRALHSLHEATKFPHYKKLYASMRDSIEEGNSFRKTFELYPKSKKLLTIPVQKLIIAAEKSGRLSKSLLQISERFQEKTEITSKNLSVILEPLLLVFVWLGVVAIALAVILPIYNLIGGL